MTNIDFEEMAIGDEVGVDLDFYALAPGFDPHSFMPLVVDSPAIGTRAAGPCADPTHWSDGIGFELPNDVESTVSVSVFTNLDESYTGYGPVAFAMGHRGHYVGGSPFDDSPWMLDIEVDSPAIGGVQWWDNVNGYEPPLLAASAVTGQWVTYGITVLPTADTVTISNRKISDAATTLWESTDLLVLALADGYGADWISDSGLWFMSQTVGDIATTGVEQWIDNIGAGGSAGPSGPPKLPHPPRPAPYPRQRFSRGF